MLFCSSVCTQLTNSWVWNHFLHVWTQSKKPASIVFNWMPRSGSAQIFSGKAKQKRDARNFSHRFLAPLSSASKGQADWEIISCSRSGFQGSVRDVCARRGNETLLLWFPVQKVPSGAAELSGASSSYSEADLRCGNKGCSDTIPFLLFLMWFSKMK